MRFLIRASTANVPFVRESPSDGKQAFACIKKNNTTTSFYLWPNRLVKRPENGGKSPRDGHFPYSDTRLTTAAAAPMAMASSDKLPRLNST